MNKTIENIMFLFVAFTLSLINLVYNIKFYPYLDTNRILILEIFMMATFLILKEFYKQDGRRKEDSEDTKREVPSPTK